MPSLETSRGLLHTTMEEASTDDFVEILASAETMGGLLAEEAATPPNPLNGPNNGPTGGTKTKMPAAQMDHIRRVRSIVESGGLAFLSRLEEYAHQPHTPWTQGQDFC